MELLLRRGADIDGGDALSRSPLFYTCALKNNPFQKTSTIPNLEAAKHILSQGAEINLEDNNGDTMMHQTIRSGSYDKKVLRLLISFGAKMESRNHDNVSITAIAIEYAPYDNVAFLVGVAERYSQRNPTWLSTAMKQGREDLIPMLIASGADVNALDWKGSTALHFAASMRSPDAIINSLFKAGAQVDLRDSSGRLALDIAVAKRSAGTVKSLVNLGADLNSFDSKWEPALISPIRHGHESMVKTLLTLGANPNTMDHGTPPKSALTCAVIFDQLNIAKCLVQHGAKVRPLKRARESDPFYWATSKGNVLMLRFLFGQLQDHERNQMGYLWDCIEPFSPSYDVETIDHVWDRPNQGQITAVQKELVKLGIQQ